MCILPQAIAPVKPIKKRKTQSYDDRTGAKWKLFDCSTVKVISDKLACEKAQMNAKVLAASAVALISMIAHM